MGKVDVLLNAPIVRFFLLSWIALAGKVQFVVCSSDDTHEVDPFLDIHHQAMLTSVNLETEEYLSEPTVKDGRLSDMLIPFSSHLQRTARTLISVSDEASFNAALASDVTIDVTANISVTSVITIGGLTGVNIDGNNYAVDGHGSVQCFYIDGGTEVTFSSLVITRGYFSSVAHMPPPTLLA
jgi:5-keto 4-deoxyuronate isomerase